ncbi:MAG: lytic transglycosylase domain-containing protein [Alcaligenaceae bacterium]|nr:lytic transglycosylase domain-containing protein [Alcaligenaceae bacterium]
MIAPRYNALLVRPVRAVVYRVGEFIHVAAIYLGIAVLVTLALALTVPSLQDQSRQLRDAVVAVFRTEPMNDDFLALFEQTGPALSASGASGSSSAAQATDGKVLPLALPSPQGGTREAPRFTSAQLNFAQAIRAAIDGRHAPGLTANQAKALRSYLARKYKIAESVAGALVNTVFVVARERGLDPQLVLAVIAIESRYNPYAESHVGAQGLMQVLTRVHKDKFEAFEEGVTEALNPIANIWVGTRILDDCIDRRGSIEGGLACYVGATGPGDGGYGAKVLAERRRIALASGIPVRNK